MAKLLLLLLLPIVARAYDNGLGRLPPMGWNSWCTGSTLQPSVCNLVGKDPCSETEVKGIADAIVEQGMDKLGYRYVALDDCWSDTSRDADGNLQPEAKKFPSGMKALADYVHGKGLLFGLYTSVGDKTCKGDRPGCFGNYERDAATLAGWGVDMVKMDHCGGKNGTDQELYGEMSKALNATGRPILFSLCNWGESSVWEWGSEVAQMFRIQMDHLPFWSFPAESAGIGYGEGTSEIIEWMATLQPSKWTKRFGWLDPDFLMTRFRPTMDFTSSRTEFSFWALWSAPLLVSTDLRKLTADKRTILLNQEVIAINQDESATAGDRLRNATNGEQLWARPLANGDKAIILYNSGTKTIGAGLAWSEIGWAATDNVTVRDLWQKKTLGSFVGGYNISTLGKHDIAMLRLTR